MIIFTVKYKLKPKMIKEFLEAAKPCIEASRKEEGNLEYKFLIDPETPDSIFIFERWKDKEATEFHSKSPHFLQYREDISPFIVGSRILDEYESSGI